MGYSGNGILSLKDINFETVDGKYSQEYRLAETMEQNGYRLAVDSIGKGISETGLHYQLTALGDYDGIVHGWHDFHVWSPLRIKDYSVSFDDPILTAADDSATADIMGQEKIVRSEGNSGSVFNTEFSLAKEDGIWKITKVDELSDAEIGE